MAEYVTTVTQKGQVTIPGELRKALKIQPKDKVAFRLVDGQLLLRPVNSVVLASFGAVEPIKNEEKYIDYQQHRREIIDEIADEVAGEG